MKRKELLGELLDAWEETYKKGQLTLWIFLALREGAKYVDEIKAFVAENTAGTISCEEQSLYRALRKHEHVGIVTYDTRPGDRGPERKYYRMTSLGDELFDRFVARNIDLFFTDKIKKLLR